MGLLDTPVSGMDSYNQWMQVIGNNIANVNTVGYKSSDVNFETMLSQTLSQGGSAAGGTNPEQVGLGVEVGQIAPDFSEGSLVKTGNPNNLAINGNGFFVVNTKQNGTGASYYERAGNFAPDSNGYLVDPNGNYLMAMTAAPTSNPVKSPTWAPVNVNVSTVSIPAGDSIQYGTTASDAVTVPTGGTATIQGGTVSGTSSPWTITGGTQLVVTDASGKATTYPITNTNGASITGGSGTTSTDQPTVQEVPSDYTMSPNGQIQVNGGPAYYLALANFENPDGLVSVGNNLYQALTGGNQGLVMYAQGGESNLGTIQQGALEQSNVDLTKQMSNMIEAQTDYNANAKVINTANGMLQFMLQQV